MARPTHPVPLQVARVSCTRRKTFAAPADRVFELASPIGEYEWIDGWRCELVHPPSGAMEKGCVFRERLSAPFLLRRPGRTTWVVARHEPAALEVEFVLFLAGAALASLVFEGERLGADSSAFTWTFTLTALSASSGKLVDAGRIEAMVGFLSDALVHYCETGKILPMGEALRRHGVRHGAGLLGLLRRIGLA